MGNALGAWTLLAPADDTRKESDMARSRTSFQKRQKEIMRMERQREKAEKRLQKKLAAKSGELPSEENIEENAEEVETPDDDGPTLVDQHT